MGDSLFTSRDFRIFEIPDFAGRMGSIAREIRPKLSRIGEVLSPDISRLVGVPVFAHVAKHARRTVNPPEDTWVAFGPERRGYKKEVHFKVAISRNCVRCLFEVGPEYPDKQGWASRWERRPGDLLVLLKRAKGIGWFKDEHDEDPAAEAKDLGTEQVPAILHELRRRREGQLVLGRRMSQAGVTGMTLEVFRKEALGAFRGLAPLFRRR